MTDDIAKQAAETILTIYEAVFEDAQQTGALPRSFEFWLSTTPEIETYLVSKGTMRRVPSTDGLRWFAATPNRRLFAALYRHWRQLPDIKQPQ